jgi:hypothetical protein
MKVDFNGIRINLARAYNGLFEGSTSIDNERVEVNRNRLAEMCEMVGAFLCIYNNDDEEFRDLSEDIKLKDPYTGKWND